ncbi:methyltransferase domain-containing protein [Candidatus Woesearchaeota archaeon]|nr:methyltransferase domain-containing protein [Candidatus Woesearchaeota archaeon]
MGYYDGIAKGYDELHKQEQLQKLTILKKWIQPKPEDKLLDVGCGTGIATTPWNCERFGIDHSQGMLEQAAVGPVYRKAYAEEIPYPDACFDYVISLTCAQNFDDVERAISEIHRVAKKIVALSFLKKSNKKREILEAIKKHFTILQELEEDKDCMLLLEKA